jgi:trehalose utilization protein
MNYSQKLSTFVATTCAVVASASEPLRVLVWDERQEEQKQAYNGGYLGDAIAKHLSKQEGLVVRSEGLNSPEQGLAAEQLDKTDVLIFWSHKKNSDLDNARADEIVRRVREGRISLVVLHSAHWSKPFVKLMQARAIDDAKKQLGPGKEFALRYENPIGTVPKINDPLTPRIIGAGDTLTLELPLCVFPSWRADGAASEIVTRSPQHPLAKGIPAKWSIAKTEMYAEPFHVPQPDEVIFEERWAKGEHFRSGCVWNIGKGRVFYFRPGHETYPIFLQAEPLQIMENAARWLSKP